MRDTLSEFYICKVFFLESFISSFNKLSVYAFAQHNNVMSS